MIRRNVLANVAGGSSSALLAFALIPLQVRLLGLESYGLLALLASVQVLFSVFDVGLSPAMTWYIARRGDDPGGRRSVLAAMLPPYALVGLLLGILVSIGAPFIAVQWLRLTELPPDVAVLAIRLGGLAIAIRWPVSLLSGFLAGAERFDVLNLAKALHAVINFAGMVVVLYALGSLPAVAAWTVLAALVECALYLGLAIRVAGGWNRSVGAINWLGDLWRYARGLAIIAALSLSLTQADRVLLARLVPAPQLGEYTAAYNLLFGLTLIQLFVSSAVYPSFAADFVTVNLGRIRDRHHDAAQVIIYLYAMPFSLLVVFGEPVLNVFLTPEGARSTVPVLALLAVGFLFNALTAVPYALSIAGGLSRLPIIVNAVSLALYLPALVLGVRAYGPAGAAAAWAALNVSYCFTLTPVAQRRLLGGGTLRWLRSVFLPFPVVGLVTFGAARLIVGIREPQDPAMWLAIAGSATIYTVVGFLLLSPSVRAHVRQLFTRSLRTGPPPIA